jgi:hypothetical protein
MLYIKRPCCTHESSSTSKPPHGPGVTSDFPLIGACFPLRRFRHLSPDLSLSSAPLLEPTKRPYASVLPCWL